MAGWGVAQRLRPNKAKKGHQRLVRTTTAVGWCDAADVTACDDQRTCVALGAENRMRTGLLVSDSLRQAFT